MITPVFLLSFFGLPHRMFTSVHDISPVCVWPGLTDRYQRGWEMENKKWII